MNILRTCLLGSAAALVLGSALAQPLTVADVKYPQTTQVHAADLQLNGAGVRHKAVFKVYTAGLYLPTQAKTAHEVMALPGAKRVAITMLREIDSGELGKLFARGMEDNMDKAAFSKLIPSVVRMGQIFSVHKKLLPGEQFNIDWVPGIGTVITVKGQPQGEPFQEPAFFNALLGIWLGPQPADAQLKQALLGHPTRPEQTAD